jgi:glyoxylate/hydroxypyruvate reductase A
MPKGAAIINPGRGAHLIDQDLLDALDKGQISAASLDVFHIEPLPEGHKFWANPKIKISPHVASSTRMDTGTQSIAKKLHHLFVGGALENLEGLMHRKRGY